MFDSQNTGVTGGIVIAVLLTQWFEFILLGLIIQSGFTQTSLKLLLIAFFLFITSPTATHAIAHAAHLSGLKPKLGPYQAPDLDDLGKGDGS